MKELVKNFLMILILIIISSNCDKKLDKKNENNKKKFTLALKSYSERKFDSASYYFTDFIKHSQKTDSLYQYSIIKLVDLYRILKNYKLSEYYYKEAKSISKQFNSKFVLTQYCLENAYRSNDPESIILNLKRTLNVVRQYQDSIKSYLLNNILIELGSAYYNLNELDSSQHFYSLSLAYLENKKINNIVKARVLSSLSLLAMAKNDEQNSSKYINECINIVEKQTNADRTTLMSIYDKLGYYFYSKDQFQKEIYYKTLKSELLEKTLDYKPLYNLYLDIASTYTYIKQFENAQIYCDKAASIINHVRGINKSDISNLYYQRGYLFSLQNNDSEAIKSLKECIRQANGEAPYFLPDAICRLGSLYAKQNNFKDCILLINERFFPLLSNYKAKSLQDAVIIPNKIYAYNLLAISYCKINNYSKSEECIAESQNLVNTYFKKDDYYDLTLKKTRGNIEIIKKNYEKASKIFDEYLQASVEKFMIVDPSNSLNVFSNGNLMDAVMGKALAQYYLATKTKDKFLKTKHLSNSLNSFELLLDLSDKQRKRSNYETDKLTLGEIFDTVPSKAIAISNELFRLTSDSSYLKKSLQFVDSKKAYVISVTINDHNNKKSGSIPDSLLKKEKELINEIFYLKNRIYDGNLTSEKQIYFTDKLYRLNNTLNKLIEKFESDYPQYFWLKYKSKPLSIDKLLSSLQKNTAIIEYSLSNDSLYIYVLTHNGIKYYSAEANTLQDSILSFRKELSTITNKTYTTEAFKSFISKAYGLYSKLIAPAEQLIKGKSIIIIPDGILNLLPFEALVVSNEIPANIDYGRLPYLVYQYPISYSYSAELYLLQQKNQSPITSGVVAFAPEYIKSATQKYNLEPLKGTEDEVEGIINTYRGNLFTKKWATELCFKQNAARNKILHLAMHTIINNENPSFSRLVFSHTNDSINDGYLNTYEIYNLNLNSPLVVLSACNTGYGKLLKGEGLISLSRGFLYAGCPSLVMTLWSVADKSSSNLMKLFYMQLKNDNRIDNSLRYAKIQYIKNSDSRMSHPYYWAGYIQSGKTEPIERDTTNFFYLNMAILLIIIGGCILAVKESL